MGFFKKRSIPFDDKIFVKHVLVYSTLPTGGNYTPSATVNLYETTISKKRSYEVFGAWTNSLAAIYWHGAVEAWLYGGPIPKGMDWPSSSTPPKPRKDLPAKTVEKLARVKGGNVVSFPEKVA